MEFRYIMSAAQVRGRKAPEQSTGRTVPKSSPPSPPPPVDDDIAESPVLVRLIPIIALLVLLPIVLATTSKVLTNTYTFGLTAAELRSAFGIQPKEDVQKQKPQQSQAKWRIYTEKELERCSWAKKS